MILTFWEAGRWPVQLDPPWLRSTLTFLVPVAFATTVPAEAISGRLNPQTLIASILLAGGLHVVSRWIWRARIRHYSGASGLVLSRGSSLHRASTG